MVNYGSMNGYPISNGFNQGELWFIHKAHSGLISSLVFVEDEIK